MTKTMTDKPILTQSNFVFHMIKSLNEIRYLTDEQCNWCYDYIKRSANHEGTKEEIMILFKNTLKKLWGQ